MRSALVSTLWLATVLAGLIAIAARWADGMSIAAIAPTQTISITAGVAFAVLLAVSLLSRKRNAWILIATGAVLAGLNAAPFLWPYRVHDVEFVSDETTLRGVIYTPVQAPTAGVVFIHGSGPQTHREFAYHARALSRAGIASFAYDKRGAGKSGGRGAVHYRQFAADAAVALRTMRAMYPDLRIGYFGHSEGGWVVPMAAAMEHPAFVIISGTTPSTPAEQVLYQSVHDTQKAYGEAIAARVRVLQEATLEYQRSGVSPQELDAQLRAAAQESWFRAAKLPDQLYTLADYAWWRSVMDYDPGPEWARVEVPVLGIWGEEDNRTDPRASAERFKMLLGELFSDKTYPEADHMVLTWPMGQSRPPPAFPSTFASDIAEWIAEH